MVDNQLWTFITKIHSQKIILSQEGKSPRNDDQDDATKHEEWSEKKEWEEYYESKSKKWWNENHDH